MIINTRGLHPHLLVGCLPSSKSPQRRLIPSHPHPGAYQTAGCTQCMSLECGTLCSCGLPRAYVHINCTIPTHEMCKRLDVWVLFMHLYITLSSLHLHIHSLPGPIYAAIYASVMQVRIFHLCFSHLMQQMHLFRGPPRTSETCMWTTEMQNLPEKIHCKCEVQCMLVLFKGEHTCSLFPRSSF